MPYSEIEAKFLGPGKELTREPCYKKLKSTADGCVFPHRGGPDNQRLQAKTGNNRVSVATIHFRRRICPQEDKTESTEVLQPLQEEMPGNKPGGAESIGSQALQDGKPSPLSRDDGIYSTSKAFIGPVYKPPEKEKCRERRAETHPLSGTEGKRRQEEKQKFNSKKLEIDTELSQFYKEIEELENENEASQGSCKEPEPSQEQIIPHDQSYNALESEEETKALRSAPQSHAYQHCVEDAPGSYPCEEEVIPAFPSFRPEWPPIHPFVLPHGPPLPSFDYHFNIERFGAPLDPLAHIFHTHAASQMRSGCYVDSCQDSWSYLTSNQMDEYANYAVTGSDFHPFRSDYSVHDDSVHSGFYETRVCWRDPPLDKHNETDRFVSQWFPEENLDKLQKLLILLRGLPGSGKTTLSRILLGQSRDGIVFSTDDYFHHQDGYRYNVNQLGDAHDWNQNRAKQAIDQGRSPVIIDNTNTQAWEMKPYVEMAIGKGYRVEFHEPETWWKFDPEELEKRNKHGVSRKKIAQMLDRYEFQMSISIVMNSVEPTQKSIQRPLPVQGEPRGRNLKKSGYRLDKSKQKRNSKGKKRNNGPSENSLGTLGHPVPGDQAHSQSEGEGSEETRREPGRPVDGGLQKDSVATVELGLTPKSSFPSKEEEGALCLPSLSVLSGSSASCHRSSQHPSSVGRVEKHRRNRHNSAFGTRDMLGKAPFPFMQKKEMMDRPEFAVHPQGGTSTSKELSREERGVKSDGWAFFTASLCDEDSQLRSESQPYLGSWPEGPHKFVCEQRCKKGRSGRLSCPGSEEQLVTVISTSEGAAGLRGGPEIPKEKKLLAGLPPEAEIVDLPRSPGTDISSSPEHPLEPAEGTYGTQRKVCNLPPHFKLLGQTPINLKEKEEYDVLTESHRQNIFFLGKDTSEIVNKDETVQKMATSDCHLLWFYFDTLLHGSPLSIVRQSGPYRLSFFRLGYAVYFYKNPAPSLMLHYLSGFCVISFNNSRTLLTFNSQKMVSRKLTEEGLVPVEGLSSQPHTFHSFRISSESQFSNERLDEKLKTPQGWEPAQCSPAEDSHELTHRNRQPLEPLSQGFAFHPVRCFGSSTVPIESLSPDDQPRDSM